VTHELQEGKLAAIEIVNAEPLRRNLDVIHPRHRPLGKDAQAFLGLLRTAAATTDNPALSRPPKSTRVRKKKK
jgi:hypothetical protein